MPLLKVDRVHINTDRIVSVTTPTSQGNQRDGAKIVLAGGEDLTVFGEDAETVRQWLASQLEPPRAATVPFVAKTEPATTNKSAPRR